jgi:HSP20 family protein
MAEPAFKKTQVKGIKTKLQTEQKENNFNSNQQGNLQADTEEGQLSIDVYETKTELIIVAPIAGVKMEDISLTVTEDILTIKGQRSLELAISEEDYLIQECFWGNFSRSIVLPSAVDATKISASFKDGVLKIAIPRTERTKTKLIRIKAAA